MLCTSNARNLMMLAVLAGATLVMPARAQENNPTPIRFTVTLPADAILLIDNYKTTSTGERRVFETPALMPGKTYRYWLKAKVDGKQIVKPLILKPGEEAAIDLRPDFTAKQMPKEEKPKTGVERAGFVTIVADGRLWVFREGSKELTEFKKNGEPARFIIRLKAGPMGMTIKAPDGATIDAYLKAK